MSSIPPVCQPIADEIASLEADIANINAAIGDPNRPEDDRWDSVQERAALTRQLNERKAALDQCIVQNSAGYQTEILILDPAGSVAAPVAARMWKVTPPSQTQIDIATLQGQRLAFTRGGSLPGFSIGVSAHDASSSAFDGAMFRSGPLSSLPPGAPGDPGGLIEIAIPQPPNVFLSPTELATLFPTAPLSLPTSPPVSLGTLTLTLNPGSITLSFASGAIVGPVSVAFTYGLTISLTPSTDVGIDISGAYEVCRVTQVGSATLAATSGGMAGFFFNALAPAFEPFITRELLTFIRSELNSILLTRAAQEIGILGIPPGVVLSMRRVTISPLGADFFPALGAYGGLVSKLPPG